MRPIDLRRRREALRLSQAELGQALGVARNTVARWERGELEIRYPDLVAPEAVNTGETDRLNNYCASVTSCGRLIQAGPGKGGGRGGWRTKRSGCAA